MCGVLKAVQLCLEQQYIPSLHRFYTEQQKGQPEKIHLECLSSKCCSRDNPGENWRLKTIVKNSLTPQKAGDFSPPRRFGLQIWMLLPTTHLHPNQAAWRRTGINILGWGWVKPISEVPRDFRRNSITAASNSNDREKFLAEPVLKEANPSRVMPRCKTFWAVSNWTVHGNPKAPLNPDPFASLKQNTFVARQTPE